MIRVAVVDDHPLVRVGFGVLIRSCEDLEFVGEAADGQRRRGAGPGRNTRT